VEELEQRSFYAVEGVALKPLKQSKGLIKKIIICSLVFILEVGVVDD
jgi:hypothetical protein